jgi:tetratricopeptide (TPR) repeat protein
MPWSAAEFAFLSDLRLGGKSTLSNSLEALIPYQLDPSPDEYGEAVLAMAEELDTASAYFRYGEMMLARGIHGAAATAFARALERNPAQRSANLLLGRCLLAQGDRETARERFRAEWELTRDPEAGEALERLSGSEPAGGVGGVN